LHDLALLDMRPTTLKNLNPLAHELLESHAAHPEAAEIVLVVARR
jgi:hypothetical protein